MLPGRDITLDLKRLGAMSPKEDRRVWRSIRGSGTLRCLHRWWKNIATGSGRVTRHSCIAVRHRLGID
jgi:hypothetical protein